MVAVVRPIITSDGHSTFRPENMAFRAVLPRDAFGHGCTWDCGIMADKSRQSLTLSRYFLEPANVTQRRYEALRAYFVEGLPSVDAARRFGYTPGSFRVLAHQFRQAPGRPFFLPSAREARPHGKQKRLRDEVVALRKQNFSIYDISRAVSREDERISPAAVAEILVPKASPSCRGGGMKNGRRARGRRWRRWRMPASSTSRRGSFAPALAACSCSSHGSRRALWTRCSGGPGFPARRWCPPDAQCALCWR